MIDPSVYCAAISAASAIACAIIGARRARRDKRKRHSANGQRPKRKPSVSGWRPKRKPSVSGWRPGRRRERRKDGSSWR